MQGNFDTKQKAISAATAQLTPFNIEYISSLLPQLWSSPRDFLWEQGGGLVCYVTGSTFQHPHPWANTKLVPCRQSSLIFLNPAKAPRKSSNEDLTFPRGHFWRLTLPRNVQYGAEMLLVTLR